MKSKIFLEENMFEIVIDNRYKLEKEIGSGGFGNFINWVFVHLLYIVKKKFDKGVVYGKIIVFYSIKSIL